MKKLISIIAVALMVFAITGCARSEIRVKDHSYVFHNITVSAPEKAVGKMLSDNEMNIFVDGSIISLLYEETDSEMTDGAESVASYTENLGGIDIKASKTTINGIPMGVAAYTLNGGKEKTYFFTVNNGIYVISSKDAEKLDNLISTIE